MVKFLLNYKCVLEGERLVTIIYDYFSMDWFVRLILTEPGTEGIYRTQVR